MLETDSPTTAADLTPPETGEAVDLRPTARDTQRNALRDLLQLSRECTTYEAELEQRHRLGVSESREKFEKTTKDFDYRLDTLRKQIKEKATAKQAQIQQHFEQELAKAKANHVSRRQKAQADYDKAKADLKKRFDHATWLADSVLEAAEVQANQEFRRDFDRQNDQNEATACEEADAAALVQTYGVKPEPVSEGTLKPEEIGENAVAVLEEKQNESQRQMQALRKLGIARLFVGIWPLFVLVLLCAAAAAVVQLRTDTPTQPHWDKLEIPVGATFVGALVIGIVLKVMITGRVKKVYTPLRLAIADTRLASVVVNQNADKLRKKLIAEATEKRNAEVDAARQRFAPVQQKAVQLRDKAAKTSDTEYEAAVAAINAQQKKNAEELQQWREKQLADSESRVRDEQARLKGRFETDAEAMTTGYADRRSQLQKRWHEGLVNIQTPMGQEQSGSVTKTNWADFERTWIPPKAFPETVAFGSLSIDLEKISAGIPRDGTEMALPDQFKVPAVLAFPRQASIIIETDPDGREEGLRALQMIMTKLLTQLPSGRARFTIIDPVGLGQSFAGFMHLADHDEQLVTSRIWTTPEQIDQRLIDMTEHMETVIQKYLRNEYETIDEYNAQAGELAEPYRFLVFADFPSGIEGESWRRLMSIARSGARCGVYTLILRDTRQSLPGDVMIEDLEAASAIIVREDGKFMWRDEIYQQFPLALDVAPDEDTLTKIVHKVGRAAKEAARVEVSFDTIAPKVEEFWTMSAANELAVPVGRMGATRLQYFRCGRGMAQHSLVAGKTGSGKSTLLHAMITNLAMWYSPDEVEFYLIDFKKGVEFKTYADFMLPHARAIAVESDREFGLSVLQRIDAELARRGEMFRRQGVQDLASYRKSSGKVLPRIMLIIDEFQEFFTEDDKVGQDAQLLLDRLVRQGRAFGIHVFLGSQTIGGSGGLARSTISQMGIRIALQCSEADSQLILGDNNGAARLLSRPGEAIYNDAGGAVENNSPFQVAFLTDERKERYLTGINNKLKHDGTKLPVVPPLVFEGNAPADLSKNAPLLAAMKAPKQTNSPVAWLGDPVAIKDPTSLMFRRQSGSNVLIIGQVDEQAMATLAAAAISLSAQLPKDRVRFVLFDGTPTDSMLAGKLPEVLAALPNETKVVEYRQVEEAIGELTEEYERRRDDAEGNFPSIFVLINGVQRYRNLRKSEDEGFSFSVSDEPKKASASKQFVDLIREGPNYGIHFIAWFDTLASTERTFERGIMREFDNRLLFQMSANDSSNLIDSPIANKLGFFRALAYSEEQGVMEKFRPYGMPPKAWLADVSKQLAERS